MDEDDFVPSLTLPSEYQEAQVEVQSHDYASLAHVSLLGVLPAQPHRSILLKSRLLPQWVAPSKLGPVLSI